MRRALVTGATGFVGGHVVGRLARRNRSLRALVRPTSDVRFLERLGVERVVGDLTSGEGLEEAVRGVDVVFHLAAVTTARDEGAYREVNAEGTRLLLQALQEPRSQARRLVYLSSYAAGGPAPAQGTRSFQEPPEPLTAYGRTKLEGERLVEKARSVGVVPVLIRAPAVYGPGDRDLLIYFRLVRRGLAPLPTGAERSLHLIYAPDLAVALERAAEAPPGSYAVADPTPYTWSRVIEAIGRALERRPLRVPLPETVVRGAAAVAEGWAGLTGRAATFNREKAEEMLAGSWIHELEGSERLLPAAEVTPLERGVAETVKWYEEEGWL